MDPVSMIIAALVAGATAAGKDVAGAAIKDAYGALKTFIGHRFGGKEPAEMAQPAGGQERLAERLRSVGAENDEELVRAAQKVLALVDAKGARAGKYDVHITGGKGIVVGDSATVTMKFDGD